MAFESQTGELIWQSAHAKLGAGRVNDWPLQGVCSTPFIENGRVYYVSNRAELVCLDSGHFHPTESIADKLSSILVFLDEVLLHVSRGVRWDSDHVVLFSDEVKKIAEEIVRGGFLERVHVGLDYFDASINRVAAWVIGMRSMLKALLVALLEPTDELLSQRVFADPFWSVHQHAGGAP